MAFVLVFTASQTTAQNGARYPESFQIKKNGTTVLLEDYASAPDRRRPLLVFQRPRMTLKGFLIN